MNENFVTPLLSVCEGVALWYGLGLLMIGLYRKVFLALKYPYAEWSGGFFIYFIGHTGEPATFIEQQAADYVNFCFGVKHTRGLRKLGIWIHREIAWTTELASHILYHRFCLEKAHRIKNAQR